MHILPGFILREVVGETVAIPSGESAHMLSGLVALNETGLFLFNLLKTDRTEDQLVEALLEEYDTDAETARADVAEFLDLLRQYQLLVEEK